MKQRADLLDARLHDGPADPPGDGPQRCLDRGDDAAACRAAATARGSTPHSPPNRSAAHPLPAPGDPARHPPRRRVVAAAHRRFNRFRRLLIRWENKADNALGFVPLAAIRIIYRKVRHARTPFG